MKMRKRKQNGSNQPAIQPHLISSNQSLKTLHKKFLKQKLHAVGTSIRTIENYRYNFHLLLQYKPNLKIYDLTEETMVNFMEFLNTRLRKVGKEYIVRVYKNSSIASVRGKLNTFFEWLTERGYLLENPFYKIKYPDVSYTDIRAFSPKELEKIILTVSAKIIWKNLLVKKRNIAIIMTLVLTGVRKEELIRLQIADLDLERSLIRIRSETSKSKRSRLIPITGQLSPYLEDYLLFRKANFTKYLWISGTKKQRYTEHGIKHFVRFLSKETKINCHLHRFRHTFAVNYYKQTKDLFGLQQLMGHRDLKMTLSYLRSIPDEYVVEQMKKLVLKEII